MQQKETQVLNKKSAIEQTSILNEIIKRERKFHSINKVFTLNLKRLKIIADKPNQVNRENLDLERREKAIPEDIKDKIKQHLFRIPSEKYEFPMTSSHDFGWEKGEKLNRNQRRFPKVGCDVTRYADEYYALKGRSPYSTREIVKDNRKQ